MSTLSNKRYAIRTKNGILGAVGEVFFAVRRWAARVIKERNLDLTFEQVMVLSVLEDEDGVGLGDLSELLDREKTTITRMVDGLERLNLAVRIPSKEDRRKKMIYLTRQGKEKINDLQKFKPEILKETTRGISKKELDLAEDVLDRIFRNLNRE